MRIQSSFTNFKANYYNLSKRNNNISLNQISTDNAEKLGNKPVLISEAKQYQMFKNGGFYTANVDDEIKKYKIFYQDTGKFEGSGKDIIINRNMLNRIVSKSVNGGIYSVVKGEAQGKLLVLNDIKDFEKKLKQDNNLSKKPLILMFKNEEFFNKMLPPNVRGIIFTNGDLDNLSHIASTYRTYFDMVSIVYDEKDIKNLEAKNGKVLTLANLNDNLQILNKAGSRKINFSKINIPPLDKTNKVLNLSECTKGNCGNKAYRLSILNKLVKNGILEDVKIPKSIVLPNEYLKQIMQLSVDEKLDNNCFKDEILSEFNDTEYVIVRSAFNGEDIDNYSAAGLYESFISTKDEILLTIEDVINSKNSERAKISRKLHQIPDEAIQPSVIVQEHINADYVFTVYTKDNDGNMAIDISKIQYGEREKPTQIIYNPQKQTFNIIKESVSNSEFLINDNYQLVSKKIEEADIVRNFEKFVPLLKKLANNTLKIEKYFGKPQDIEGGLKNGELYLWQARNIIKRVHN